MKNKYLVCIPICIVAILARKMLTADVDIVMAMINIMAFLFVIYFAYNDTLVKVKEGNKKLIAVDNEIDKIYAKIRFSNGVLVLICCTVCAGIYILNFVDALYNDAISIVALAASVISDEISEKWAKQINKNIEKTIEKRKATGK